MTMAAGAADAVALDFPDRVRSGHADLELCGSGVARYRRIIKVYRATLYRRNCGATDLFAAPMRLELAYFRSIDGARFGQLAETSLRSTLSPASFSALEERLSKLHRAYRSVEPGDRYALTYRPGEGTRLDLNGDTLERINGRDFARAYFGLWLGPRPLDSGLRDRLITSPQERSVAP